MRSSGFLQGLAAVCIAATASAVSAQTAIQLFGPVNVRPSTQGTGYGNQAKTFNSKMLNLSCPSPVHATISSSPDGNGNVLVDNYVSLSVGGNGPVNICRNGVEENGGQQDCFTSSYQSQASNGGLNGQDPDGFVSTGGVPPIDISNQLWPGMIQTQISLVDTGGYLTSSSLYLVTNCTSQGITGPGLITGNPIPSSSPTNPQLAQSYPFNPTTNQQIQFTYDLSQAQASGKLSIPNGSTPSTANLPLSPATFPSYLTGTSFATANCLVHTGEVLNGSPACELYTLACQIGTNPSQSGALCPVSQVRNEIFQEVFDGPNFTLPDVAGTDGLTFHQGVGLLEAKEEWSGGSCVFDPASSIANLLCPQNVLTSFSGPGAYRSGGSGQSPNSTFITVAPVPEDLTAVAVTGQQPGYWINSHNATVNFVSTPPALASSNNFVASPIQSLTYGISSASSVPQPGSPVPGDITLPNTACPAPGSSNPPPASVFKPSAQDISVSADGNYLVHYFAQDCAGTEELQFTQAAGSWSTSFYTFPINVDTVAPVVLSGPTLSPAPSTNGGVADSYLVGQKVTATYRCTDDRSGIVKCGTSTYAPGTTLDTGNLTSPVDTSKAGPATFTVNAVDAAGNKSSASVNYQVVSLPPVNLSILKIAPLLVKQNTQLAYGISAFNLGKQAASSVTITDPLPAGVTFVSAKATQPGTGTVGCTFANSTVSCTAPSMTLLTPITVKIVVSVQAAPGSKIKNTATVSSANPEGQGITQSTAITLVY
ncbi:MAG: hypothetical protein ABSC65_06670 [Acidobacteriaceae bacterium]|jgi:uncharacterized repeat protein (TIGR01451 family)